MIKEFRLPELGENITSGDVVQVLVAPGDRIEKDQPILEIETDKATIEVPAEAPGRVKEVLVKAGDTAEVGQLILTVETNAEAEAPAPGATAEAQAEAPAAAETQMASPAVEESATQPPTSPPETAAPAAPAEQGAPSLREFRLPELGENITEGEVVQVHVQAGDRVEKDQILLEIETDKATIEVPSPYAGTVKKVMVQAGDRAEVGQLICTVETTEEAAVSAPPQPAAPAPAATPAATAPPAASPPATAPSAPTPLPPVSGKRLVPASPSVRRFAREIGIDITQVTGTGPGGRITIEDVKRFSRDLRSKPAAAPQAAAAIAAPPLPDFSKWGAIRREAMSNVRKATARGMAVAWNTIPHVTQFDKADITELEKLRKKFSPKAEAQGAKLTITAILLKITAAALKVFPQFNASIDVEKQEIIFKDYYHIGVAVDTERGLLVPVIRDVDKKNIVQLSVELNEAAERARNRKTSLEELQGGTFTITNLGGIGGTYFTPIVNWPEVAILGVSRGSYEPVYIDGEFVPRLMLPLSVSYDHRIIDGADAARFLRWIVSALEQPFMIALEG